MEKVFKLPSSEILPLAPGCGACFASDMITVHGRPVGYMYREAPDSRNDSGWRFLGGDETEEYLNDPDNLGMYDVNTIANYDRDIMPLLGAPIGAAYERNEAGDLVAASPPERTD